MAKLTSKTFVLALKEFMLVWINQILFYNRVYSTSIYDQAKSFNIIIYKNRNPKLEGYLSKLLQNFFKSLIIGRQKKEGKAKTEAPAIDQLEVIIYSIKSKKVKKKYVLHFSDLIASLSDLMDDITDDEKDFSAEIAISDAAWKSIHSQFNSLLHQHVNELKRTEKLDIKARQDRESILGATHNDEYFFKIVAKMDERIDLINQDWVKVQDKKADSTKKLYVPIGEVSMTLLNFEVHNEYF